MRRMRIGTAAAFALVAVPAPAQPRTVRIQVERDGRGEPRALLIHTSRGPVRAARVP